MSGKDDQRLMRIINEPKRKIGASTVETVAEIARMNGLSMFDVLCRAYEYPILSKVSDKLLGFVEIIDCLRSLVLKPSELIPEVFEITGYKDMLLAEGFEGETRIQHVEEFISAAKEYEERCEDSSTEPTLQGFLEEVALVSDVDKYDDNADAVVLMTIHSAKGLEFPIVFLAGMEDGIFPSLTNMTDPAEMEEERRLCYVALTRAKHKLYITYAKERMLYGRTNVSPLSLFIRRELPSELLKSDGVKKVPPRAPYSPYPPESRGSTSSEGRDWRSQAYQRPTFSSGAQNRPQTPKPRSTPESYGVRGFSVGTRVKHVIFGEGTVTASKPMGGDILYTVKFDTAGEKRLMATYAKLEAIK